MITYGPFILFEGIGKNFSFNSILDFAILSDFKTRTVFTTEDGGGGGPQLVSNQLKVLSSLAPPQYSKPCPPLPHPQYSKPSYAYGTCIQSLIAHMSLMVNSLHCHLKDALSLYQHKILYRGCAASFSTYFRY